MKIDQTTFTAMVEEWLDWAYDNDIHPAVLYIVEQHPDLFLINDGKGIITIKHWKTISDDLNERGGSFVFEKLFMDKYKNWIGEHRVNILRECYRMGR